MRNNLIQNSANLKRILRLIVTTKCNYACIYCHQEGMTDATKDVLDYSDYAFMVESAIGFFDGIAIAGGEPLLYPDLINIAKFSFTALGKPIHMTTNGSIPMDNIIRNIHLFERINVSINSLVPETFYRITNNSLSDVVFKNVGSMVTLGLPIHVNAVILNGYNVSIIEVNRLLEFSRSYGLQIEFLHCQASTSAEENNAGSGMREFREIMKYLGYTASYRHRPYCAPNTLYTKGDYRVILRDYGQVIDPELCKNCRMVSLCTEGISHIRLLPDGLLTSCRYGVAMQEDISQLLKERNFEKIGEAIVKLQKLYTHPIYWRRLYMESLGIPQRPN